MRPRLCDSSRVFITNQQKPPRRRRRREPGSTSDYVREGRRRRRRRRKDNSTSPIHQDGSGSFYSSFFGWIVSLFRSFVFGSLESFFFRFLFVSFLIYSGVMIWFWSYLIWLKRECEPATRSRPSRIRPRQPDGPACRTWSGRDPTSWCPRLVPRSAKSWSRAGLPRPSLPSRAVSRPATGSSPKWPTCWASLCISGKLEKQNKNKKIWL